CQKSDHWVLEPNLIETLRQTCLGLIPTSASLRYDRAHFLPADSTHSHLFGTPLSWDGAQHPFFGALARGKALVATSRSDTIDMWFDSVPDFWSLGSHFLQGDSGCPSLVRLSVDTTSGHPVALRSFPALGACTAIFGYVDVSFSRWRPEGTGQVPQRLIVQSEAYSHLGNPKRENGMQIQFAAYLEILQALRNQPPLRRQKAFLKVARDLSNLAPGLSEKSLADTLELQSVEGTL
ncbi:hypothetical protein, partial [Okeania sp. SIO1H5]|uniref:hypothetical protein n=1 Tax=Okeania sp. SIO1H5 TaxID=2607777 RepID=UPI00257CEB5D